MFKVANMSLAKLAKADMLLILHSSSNPSPVA